MQTTFPTHRPRTFALRRSGADFLIIWLCVAILSAVGLYAGWQFWHTDRIFTGVRVAGVPIGGETRASALLRLNRELSPYPLAPIVLAHEDRQWALGAAQLAPQPDLEEAINRAYLLGREGGLLRQVGQQWQAVSQGVSVSPPVAIDENAVRQAVAQAAADVRQPGRPALTVGAVSLPAQPGVDVDISATAQRILAQAHSGRPGVVPLQTVTTQPPAAAPAQQPTAAEPAALPTGYQPLVLQSEQTGIEFALDPATLQKLLPSGDPQFLDEAGLRSLVAEWAEQVFIPAQDARLRFDTATNQPVVLQPSSVGQRLNIDRTVEAVRSALLAQQPMADLPIEAVTPDVDSTRLADLGIRELISVGTTFYAGSSRARIRNIEVAAEKFVGVVIPPNGIFSFNSTVEAVSAANGFEDSAIIWGDRTAVGVGGGVCQVSTTVFRAAFQAGFPLVERYNHGYVVSWYGEPGLDATIYTPSVDFKFRNDSDAYLLIQPVVDSVNGVISFEFYGTKPDRQVTIGEPVIADVKEPGEPVYREDPSLAAGEIEQVEWPKQGMVVTVIRTITENGQTRENTLTSVYQPWTAVYLYGPGTVIPGVTDRPTTDSP